MTTRNALDTGLKVTELQVSVHTEAALNDMSLSAIFRLNYSKNHSKYFLYAVILGICILQNLQISKFLKSKYSSSCFLDME